MTTKRALLWCGVIGPVFFTLAYLIEGATRADYDPMRDPVSALSLGSLGWTQVINFLVTGVLFLLFAFGLRGAGQGWALPICVAIIGFGLIGAGLFRTDPVGPGVEPTTLGALHDEFSLGVFVGLPVACLVAAFRFGRARRLGLAAYSLVTAIVFSVLFVLTGIGFSGDEALVAVGGLMQRLTLTAGFAWVVAVAADALRRSSVT